MVTKYVNSFLLICCVFILSIATSVGNGEVPNPLTASEKLAKIVKLGPGVYDVKKDKKGHITSCVVVGSARISTVLGKGKGLEIAREKAHLAATAEFSRWLKEEVRVYSSNNEETITILEGKEGAEESLVEAGKSIDKSSKVMESISSALIRGLQVIHKDIDGDEKNYTLVMGWSSASAEAVKKVTADLENDSPTTAGKSKPAKIKVPAKKIDDDSATSDEADKFLK